MGSWSRSQRINWRASSARYSLTPRRPMSNSLWRGNDQSIWSPDAPPERRAFSGNHRELIMADASSTRDGFVSVASVQVDAVTPRNSGFTLQASGEDSAEYLLDMTLDMRLDRQTQTVVGEILAQSEWRLYRRARQPLKRRLRKRANSS